jgi:hypothetical protein
MLQRCYYGAHEINCCDVFVPYYVMLRGRCMRLNHTLYQMDPADYGRIDIYLVGEMDFQRGNGFSEGKNERWSNKEKEFLDGKVTF